MGSFLFYSAAVGFSLGIFTRSFFEYGSAEIIWIGLIGVVLGLIGSRKNSVFAPFLVCLSIFLIFFSCGLLRMEIAMQSEVDQALELQLDHKVLIEGEIVREPDIRESTQQLYVKVDEELILVTTGKYEEVAYGDVISFEGTLKKPEAFETDLGRTFNYKGYLQARGVNYVVSFAKIKVLNAGKGNFAVSKLLAFKHGFVSRIELVIPQPQVGLAEGLLLGIKKALGEDLENAFRTTGIMHIVVLSGYNIMIVVTFVMYVLALMLPLRARILFGGITIVLFACLVGLSATVIRASGMAVLILIAKATGRTYAVMRALVFTGIVMLLLNPYLLAFDVGFQLSFIATLGLILVSPHLEKYLNFMPTKIGLREFLTATVATQIFVSPILLYQMGQFSVVAVIVNVLVLPMVPVAMLLTFITGMVGFISTALSFPIGFLAHLSLSYILFIAETFAKLPFASFTVPAFPFYVVVLSYIFLGGVLWYLYTRKNVVQDSLARWIIVEEETITKS